MSVAVACASSCFQQNNVDAECGACAGREAHGWSTLLGDAGDELLVAAQVDGDGDRAGAHASEEREHPLGRVGAPDGDAVAGLDAFRLEE